MFTRILRISVGKSEMKLAQAGPSATPEASQVSSLEKKAQQALKNVQDYK